MHAYWFQPWETSKHVTIFIKNKIKSHPIPSHPYFQRWIIGWGLYQIPHRWTTHLDHWIEKAYINTLVINTFDSNSFSLFTKKKKDFKIMPLHHVTDTVMLETNESSFHKWCFNFPLQDLQAPKNISPFKCLWIEDKNAKYIFTFFEILILLGEENKNKFSKYIN
jgi:hypothetical protein